MIFCTLSIEEIKKFVKSLTTSQEPHQTVPPKTGGRSEERQNGGSRRLLSGHEAEPEVRKIHGIRILFLQDCGII